MAPAKPFTIGAVPSRLVESLSFGIGPAALAASPTPSRVTAAQVQCKKIGANEFQMYMLNQRLLILFRSQSFMLEFISLWWAYPVVLPSHPSNYQSP